MGTHRACVESQESVGSQGTRNKGARLGALPDTSGAGLGGPAPSHSTSSEDFLPPVFLTTWPPFRPCSQVVYAFSLLSPKAHHGGLADSNPAQVLSIVGMACFRPSLATQLPDHRGGPTSAEELFLFHARAVMRAKSRALLVLGRGLRGGVSALDVEVDAKQVFGRGKHTPYPLQIL